MKRLAFVLLVTGCGSQTVDPSTLQMNDVTIMFPLAQTNADFAAYLGPTSLGANGSALLPEALYESDDLSGEVPYDELRVVGMRLDPCFDHVGPITDPSTCDNQMRLVYQVIDFAAGATTAEDSGVHVMYRLTRDQLLDAAGAIAATREQLSDADLGPLAVHPLIASEGMTGEFASQLSAIIRQYADASKIERITTFSIEGFSAGEGGTDGGSGSDIITPLPDAEGAWDLHGFTVANDVETPLQIATLPAATTDMSVDASVNPLDANAFPATGSADDISILENASEAGSATTAELKTAFDSALQIENPMKNSPDTIDCASCHMAEPARVLVGQGMFDMSSTGDANAFAADPSIPSADLAATTQANLIGSDGVLDIHAFSYRLDEPIINQRVINETAANLAYLHSL